MGLALRNADGCVFPPPTSVWNDEEPVDKAMEVLFGLYLSFRRSSMKSALVVCGILVALSAAPAFADSVSYNQGLVFARTTVRRRFRRF
jgi:hypothetical protein